MSILFFEDEIWLDDDAWMHDLSGFFIGVQLKLLELCQQRVPIPRSESIISLSLSSLPSDTNLEELSIMPKHTESGRILVVEDSISQAKMIVRRLRDTAAFLGQLWHITLVNNAEEVVSRFDAGELYCDIAFIDQNLSSCGKTGIDLITTMRNKFEHDCVIIMCTGGIEKYARVATEVGADSIWPKPLPGVQELARRLVRFRVTSHL